MTEALARSALDCLNYLHSRLKVMMLHGYHDDDFKSYGFDDDKRLAIFPGVGKRRTARPLVAP